MKHPSHFPSVKSPIDPLGHRRKTCFEESEAGLEYFDYLTDLAIENDVWGFAFSTYNGPEMPVWWARQKWLTETNHRFLNGVVKGTEAS
jgi:hypothetical protein